MTDRFVKVDGEPDLVRDSKSGAIIQTNNREYVESKQRRVQASKVIATEKKIAILEARLAAIESTMRNVMKILENGSQNST